MDGADPEEGEGGGFDYEIEVWGEGEVCEGGEGEEEDGGGEGEGGEEGEEGAGWGGADS